MSCFNQEEFPIIVGYTGISKLGKITTITCKRHRVNFMRNKMVENEIDFLTLRMFQGKLLKVQREAK